MNACAMAVLVELISSPRLFGHFCNHSSHRHAVMLVPNRFGKKSAELCNDRGERDFWFCP